MLSPTYRTILTLQRKDTEFKAGLCLSKASLGDLETARDSFLHPKEHLHFDTLNYPKRQYSYLLGRYCAKQAVAAYTDQSNLAATHIDNGVFQQPIVSGLQHSNIDVSISHASAIGAALAFPQAHPMGIDIERIHHSKSKALQTYVTIAERMRFGSEIIGLTLLWTVKEALSKVLKCGLMVPHELLEVETVTVNADFSTSYFKNFYQYKAFSFLIAECVCSIVYPKKTQLELDTAAIQLLIT
jgi:4'-phosphopantetheinyl transferase